MSFLHHSIIGALVPALVKKTPVILKKIFKLQPIDDITKARVAAKEYPRHYKIGYALWLLCLFSSGFIALGYIAFYLPITSDGFDFREYWRFVFLGLINMVGVWLVAGAILDQLFWFLSSDNFKDYVRYRNIKEGMDVDVTLQIKTLWKIGILYYIVLLPVMLGLLIFGSNKMEQETLQKIKTLPEVAAFVTELEQHGKKASFRVDDQENEWSVQVYEIVARDGESHTATFNWYRVNKKSGAVDKEF